MTLLGVTGTSIGTFYVQGLQQGQTTVTITATGYQTRVATITVTPSGFAWFTSIVNTTPSLWGGLTVDVPVISSNIPVGSITTSPVIFNGGDFLRNTQFDPDTPGTIDINIGVPAGLDTPSNNQTIPVTVNP